MRRRWIQSAAAVVVLSACTPDAAPPAADTLVADTAAAAQLIDSTIAPAVAGVDGWNYAVAADADLTGDGQPERVVLTARVEMYRGRPAWDDGQPWQVYVEEPDRVRTYLYAQRLQLGTLAMRVSRADSGEAATIILLEHLPDRLSVFEARYASPGRATVVSRFEREVDPRGQSAAPMLP
jgi:hypothetical protein